MIQKPVEWSAHSLGVANYMREHAEERGLSPDDMFICGLLHDVGDVYGEYGNESIGALMLAHVGMKSSIVSAIRLHSLSGYKVEELYGINAVTPEYKLLLEANMRVDNRGNRVTYEERLEKLLFLYGKEHEVYRTCYDLCMYLKELEKEQ